MLLQIKYFGLLTEVTNCSNEQVEFLGSTVDDLIDQLHSSYPELAQKDFKVAINQELVSTKTKITHPEVALLPPFSGG